MSLLKMFSLKRSGRKNHWIVRSKIIGREIKNDKLFRCFVPGKGIPGTGRNDKEGFGREPVTGSSDGNSRWCFKRYQRSSQPIAISNLSTIMERTTHAAWLLLSRTLRQYGKENDRVDQRSARFYNKYIFMYFIERYQLEDAGSIYR